MEGQGRKRPWSVYGWKLLTSGPYVDAAGMQPGEHLSGSSSPGATTLSLPKLHSGISTQQAYVSRIVTAGPSVLRSGKPAWCLGIGCMWLELTTFKVRLHHLLDDIDQFIQHNHSLLAQPGPSKDGFPTHRHAVILQIRPENPPAEVHIRCLTYAHGEAHSSGSGWQVSYARLVVRRKQVDNIWNRSSLGGTNPRRNPA